MPAIEISRSMLVNQGLSALPDLAHLTEHGDSPAVGSGDAVASFKRLVVDDAVSMVDRDLVASIVDFKLPVDVATYFINAKYAELGGATGLLGTTTSAVGPSAGGAGFMRTFQHGAIYFHPQVGTHEVHGPVRLRWQELGGDKGFLGFPTSDITPGLDVRSQGVFAHFQGGSIYWAPLPRRVDSLATSTSAATMGTAPAVANTAATTGALRASSTGSNLFGTGLLGAQDRTASAVRDSAKIDTAAVGGAVGIGIIKQPIETSAGAFEVHGAIREKYLALGAEASILGYPRTDETPTPDGIGRFNHFQTGSIYWTPATFAHEVHGLIRDRWATLGWERNPQLGYPISDEMIPDPRIGHRRPEAWKKPILSMPSDVIKLPAEAALAGFPRTVVNMSALAATRAPDIVAANVVVAPANPATPTGDGALGRLSDKTTDTVMLQPPSMNTLDPRVFTPALNPASTPAEARSVNRFGDFENGVLLWFRGATSASTIAPLTATSDGTSLSFSGADVATAAVAKIGRGTFEGANARVTSVSFVGTTGYSFDGAQTHNRRHRLQVIVQGVENVSSGPFGISVPTAVTATIELFVEVWLDASRRLIALTPTDWTVTQASSSSYATAINGMLRARLDPLLWTSYELVTLPDTDGGAPIAVLSVKTLVNGAIAVFVEPRNKLVLGGMIDMANSVAPSVVLVSQPN